MLVLGMTNSNAYFIRVTQLGPLFLTHTNLDASMQIKMPAAPDIWKL